MYCRWRAPLPTIVLDEIALEGLEGITIEGLWKRLSVALTLPVPFPDKFQNDIWKFILTAGNVLEFYLLPSPREKLKIFDRFKALDPDYGIPQAPDECPYTEYKCVPVSNEKGIRGTCELFYERTAVPLDEIKGLSLSEVDEKYGEKLVIVASQTMRESAIIADTAVKTADLTVFQYCILEIIGRSRYNGETTAGKYSLQNFGKDSTGIFYIRNKLIESGLINKQPYTELQNGRINISCLLTLTRFYRENKTVYTIHIEKIFSLVKEMPNHQMPLDKLKTELTGKARTNFKKFSQTVSFRKIFELRKTSTKELDPTSESKGSSMIIKLRNPNMKEEELFLEDDSKDDGEERIRMDKIEFFDEKHYFLDMPYTEQVYRALDRFGNTGGSQTQLMKYLAISKLNIRGVIKRMLRLGLITWYSADFGRQRTKMYVTVRNSKKSKNIQEVESSSNVLKNLKCTENPVINLEKSAVIIPNSYLPEMEHVVSEVEWPKDRTNTSLRTTESARQAQRKNLIVDLVNEKLIISIFDLKNTILKIETEAGHKDQICKKSVVRCVHWLCERNIVKYFELKIKYDGSEKAVRCVTHPTIGIDHPVMLEELYKMKLQFYSQLEERKYKELHTSVSNVKETPQMKPLIRFELRSPKFIVARFFHELLFYSTYELSPQSTPLQLTTEIVDRWKEFNPSLDIETLAETDSPKVYQETMNWKMFIPPLIKYEDKPAGWVYFPEILDRVPLSIFSKIFQIDRSANPKINEFLLHPVKQHFLIQNLPADLRTSFSRCRMYRVYVQIIKILNSMGLIQTGERQYKDPTHLWIYTNRKASFLDTTPSQMGHHTISPNINYDRISFEFQSNHDVERYWNELHRICIHTKLGFPKSRERRPIIRRTIVFQPAVDFQQAATLDNGTIPGDHLGAGGIDSILCTYYAANWSWQVPQPKMLKKQSSRGVKLSKLQAASSKLVRKKKVSMVSAKRITAKKSRVAKVKPKYVCDEVDKDALKHMKSLRVKWKPVEDKLLKMVRVVLLYIGQNGGVLNLLVTSKIARDVLRLNGFMNKTSMSCLRRGQFLVKRNRHLPEVPSWLYQMQKNTFINRKYGENFLKNLKNVYPEKNEYEEAMKVHFVLLLAYLDQMINKTSDICEDKYIAIPDTLAEFYEVFKETRVEKITDAVLLHKDPENVADIEIATINNMMHSSLCCAKDKTVFNLQLFEIYKNYSEDVLHRAFDKARKDSLVVTIKRRFMSDMHPVSQMTGPAFMLSNKYKLQLQFLTIPYFVFERFYTFLDRLIDEFYGKQRLEVMEFKSPNSGQMLLICELLRKEQINLDVRTPYNILTVDSSAQGQSISDPERILDHFRQIFDNAPQMEYIKNMEESNEGSSQPKVKFNIASQKYTVSYNPYDLLTKLGDASLHFFCTLDNLYRGMSLDFSKIAEDNFCSVNCVLKSANYIGSIEKIIQEKKLIIEDCSREFTGDEPTGSVVVVTPGNLLHVFNKMREYLVERNLETDTKDVGKKYMKQKTIDMIELCKELLEYTDDDQGKGLEYEPTLLNKDDRFARAQDVFVVNLPTVRISPKDSTERTVYKDAYVPKELVAIVARKEAILERITQESVWIDHQNTIEDLMNAMRIENFSKMEIDFTIELLEYLETLPLGALASDLVSRYKNENLLVKATRILRKNYFVMRAGIEQFMYVHKAHIAPWVIRSYHIKRLEKESMEIPTVDSLLKAEKRKLSGESEQPTKMVKIDDERDEADSGKRVSRPVERYANENPSTSESASAVKLKKVIIMKPCPWIRVNGSLNRRALDKWIGSILSECMSRAGCTITEMALRFNQMHPVDVFALLEILKELDCIEIRCLKRQNVTLFSVYEDMDEVDATEFSHMDDSFIIAKPHAVLNLSLFIGDKKYNVDFI